MATTAQGHINDGAIISRRDAHSPGTRYHVVAPDGGVREVPVTQPLKAGFRYATAADIKASKAKAAALDAADDKAPPKPSAPAAA